ncbi:hypothetical protein THAOC_17261 [Thalassiosira oceanica]|uniref:Secreted protein n=1 Tax=Thalassiosira oceanica TaxID=159749 RepID=K0SMJ0_THAOC|nr:hypothetical protein THAOC_17261 [Thalassiosira oceanica]|eukprot:EJK62141.1 hypothetical protein THAOC_17261 [Thalassiosira oceanica]
MFFLLEWSFLAPFPLAAHAAAGACRAARWPRDTCRGCVAYATIAISSGRDRKTARPASTPGRYPHDATPVAAFLRPPHQGVGGHPPSPSMYCRHCGRTRAGGRFGIPRGRPRRAVHPVSREIVYACAPESLLTEVPALAGPRSDLHPLLLGSVQHSLFSEKCPESLRGPLAVH